MANGCGAKCRAWLDARALNYARLSPSWAVTQSPSIRRYRHDPELCWPRGQPPEKFATARSASTRPNACGLAPTPNVSRDAKRSANRPVQSCSTAAGCHCPRHCFCSGCHWLRQCFCQLKACTKFMNTTFHRSKLPTVLLLVCHWPGTLWVQ